MEQYRHELKYYLGMTDYCTLLSRLRGSLKHDENADQNGRYTIRSLYFDDCEDTCLTEKLDGVNDRDKYRIRIYNYSDAVIKLECKHKDSGYILKKSVLLNRRQCDMLLGGNPEFLLKMNNKVARQMYIAFREKALTPRVIVDYERESFVCDYGNVRITFDDDVRTAYRSTDIFNSELPTYPVIENGHNVLEVKFDDVLPGYVAELLSVVAPVRSAISKYCMCRKFEL